MLAVVGLDGKFSSQSALNLHFTRESSVFTRKRLKIQLSLLGVLLFHHQQASKQKEEHSNCYQRKKFLFSSSPKFSHFLSLVCCCRPIPHRATISSFSISTLSRPSMLRFHPSTLNFVYFFFKNN
jgi:hypothetical protein